MAARSQKTRASAVNSGRARLLSLDMFRGLAVAGMILVDFPGDWKHVYAPFAHAEWHGWTPTDLIFPSFLFIVGVALTFTAAKYGESDDRSALYARILRRSLLLFGLGLLLNAFLRWDLAHLRIPGVLQRIAACYFAASLIALNVGWKGVARCTAFLLLGYWLLLLFVPVPGSVAGDLSKHGSLPSWVDRIVFGVDHIFRRSYDPEGILSTIPAIATTLIGVLTGHWLRARRDAKETTVWMLVSGCMLFAAGYVWSAFFPINKALWTSSYVLLAAGLDLFFLALCYWTVDGLGWRKWARPFEVYGRNALLALVLPTMLSRTLRVIQVTGPAGQEIPLRTWIYESAYLSWLKPENASLAFALSNVLLWLGVFWLLYRRRIFVKL